MFRKPNPSSGVPIYVQLKEQVRHAIETGGLTAGDQLPGIRSLAETLVINPNTVIKVYRELEQEGVLEILLRVPERRVAWRVIRAGSPCDHLAAGVVSFIPLSDQRTCVVLKVSSRLKGAGSRQVDRYLQNFKHLVEERTCETNGG